MGILTKWGESTYFFSVGYYVMHLFFDVCVFEGFSFFVDNLVLFFNRACQSFLFFF
jgi:hypothetical protein